MTKFSSTSGEALVIWDRRLSSYVTIFCSLLLLCQKLPKFVRGRCVSRRQENCTFYEPPSIYRETDYVDIISLEGLTNL